MPTDRHLPVFDYDATTITGRFRREPSRFEVWTSKAKRHVPGQMFVIDYGALETRIAASYLPLREQLALHGQRWLKRHT